MKRLNGVTTLLLSLAFLLSLANAVLVFFVHIPVNARFAPRTYFQAYGAPELFLAFMGLVITSLVGFLLCRQSAHHQSKCGGAAWSVSIAGLILGVIGLLVMPRYMFLVGSFSLGRASVSPLDNPKCWCLRNRRYRQRLAFLAERRKYPSNIDRGTQHIESRTPQCVGRSPLGRRNLSSWSPGPCRAGRSMSSSSAGGRFCWTLSPQR